MKFLVKPRELSFDELDEIRGGTQCMIYCASDEGCGLWNSCIEEVYYGCKGPGNYLYPPI